MYVCDMHYVHARVHACMHVCMNVSMHVFDDCNGWMHVCVVCMYVMYDGKQQVALATLLGVYRNAPSQRGDLGERR